MNIYYATMGEILVAALFAVMILWIIFMIADDMFMILKKRVKVDKKVYKRKTK